MVNDRGSELLCKAAHARRLAQAWGESKIAADLVAYAAELEAEAEKILPGPPSHPKLSRDGH
jgi:hypothetical protein